MEVLNYQPQLPGKSTIALFSVYIQSFRLTLHKLRLIRTKKGHLLVSLPAYSVDQPDGTKKWLPYIEFSAEKNKEFLEKVFEALKPFVT